ncbi:peptidyl-prolyl cis-trans isomerase [bacterium]|jgi:parvulin-like peptidyl-prolyl isomerase|nr:peptidyl-prolyl cis-trans isomerase [bacterium]
MKKFLVFVVIAVTVAFVNGCSKKDITETPAGRLSDDEVVASINGYGLTVGEFKEQAEYPLIDRYFSKDPATAKEEILENLVMKNILLQEAQKLNFDKDKEFMRDIEHYWQQALLKLLLNRKAAEITGDVSVKDAEILYEYKKMRRKMFAGLTVLSSKETADKLSAAGENFEKVKKELKDNILSDEPADWWVAGDLPDSMENKLFELTPGGISVPVRYGNGWVVMRLTKEEVRDIAPIEKISQQIKENILEKKKEMAMELWALEVRGKAKVEVNEELLDKINLD